MNAAIPAGKRNANAAPVQQKQAPTRRSPVQPSTLIHWVAAAALSACATLAQAQAWPNRPITIILPVTAGSSIDVVSRTIGNELGKRLGQAVIFDNKVGASGNIGVAAAAKAAPDGYTILISSGNITMAPALTANLPWDPRKSFAPVAMLFAGVMSLAINPDVPARTLPEFIAYMQKNPGVLNYATPGLGSPHHFGTELLMQTTNTKMVHVPYKGTGPAIIDLIGGRVQFGYFSMGNLIEHQKSGKLRVLATSWETRLPQAPDVPTLRELGLKEADITGWAGMFAPAGMPPDILARLRREVAEVLKMPTIQTMMAQQAVMPINPGTAEQLQEIYAGELDRWPTVAAKAGIKPE